MQVLVIPDVHLKTWMFRAADRAIEKERPDAVVLLGDLVDDFGCKNSPDRYVETIDAAIAFIQKHPESYLCLGNHEASYLWNRETNATAYRARSTAKEQCWRLTREIPQERFMVAFQFDNIIFSHAGISEGFFAAHLKKSGETYISDEEVIRRVNRLSVDELWRYGSPIWYRPSGIQGFDQMYGANRMLHVTGHTPVEKITEWCSTLVCDTFSTQPNHKPIGDETFAIVDTQTKEWRAVRAVSGDVESKDCGKC